MREYELIVGLEIHVQLNTKSKMFSTASNDIWQEEPNSHVTPVEIGLPGALPVPNKKAIISTQRFGNILNCTLPPVSKFDRKNYFYPDLPKGYQISQYDQPLCINGYLDITAENGEPKRITIRRVHLEEDTAKSLHKDGKTYIDFNKAGVPLMELVTEPDFRSADEVSVFSKMIQTAVRTLGVSNGDMEKGNIRLEANISVRKKGEGTLPTYRVEIKNINSFKFLRDAITYEFDRQVTALKSGETLFMETRGWDEEKNQSVLQRRKETESDYRYFPEPDIPTMVFDEDYFNKILANTPKMPWDIQSELLREGVRKDYAHSLAYNDEKYHAYLHYKGKIAHDELVKIIIHTKDMNTVSAVISEKRKQKDKPLLDNNELSDLITQVISSNGSVVNDYLAGKKNALHFLLGHVMKNSKGRADAAAARKLLEKKLSQ